MGIFGHLECTAGCGYIGSSVYAGDGMRQVRTIKRCAACGQLTDVLTARIEDGETVAASGRGRCPDCGSRRLRAAPDVDALIDGGDRVVACPRCSAPLRWEPTGIWD